MYEFADSLRLLSRCYALKGNFHLEASDGRIHHFVALVKIFKLLAVTEMFKGRLPEITKNGFAYRTIKINGDIDGKKMSLIEAVIDTPSIEIISEGDIDLADFGSFQRAFEASGG